jgi:uncharacterized protein YdbL (DUF1318 family)
MNDPKKALSPLAQAALALDEELRRFEALTAAALRVPLDSKRNLEKAARATTDAAVCQGRIGELVQAFMAALNAARDENQAAAAKLTARGAEVQARTAEYARFVERFSALGDEAADISRTVARVGTEKAQRGHEAVTDLVEIEARMARVVDGAQELGREAKAAGWTDLVGQLDGLRQQTQSARNKVKLLREQLRAASPAQPH